MCVGGDGIDVVVSVGAGLKSGCEQGGEATGEERGTARREESRVGRVLGSAVDRERYRHNRSVSEGWAFLGTMSSFDLSSVQSLGSHASNEGNLG